MKQLIEKYVKKLIEQNLAERKNIYLLGLDDVIFSNVDIHYIHNELIKIFDLININSLLFAEPSEPYRTIIKTLTGSGIKLLTPSDCETRTFLHDIPIINKMDAQEICMALSKRKAVIIRDAGIVSYGTVSPEQSFISFSSVCFSTFVKYFTDIMFSLKGVVGESNLDYQERILNSYTTIKELIEVDKKKYQNNLQIKPILESDDDILQAMAETGKILVRNGLVDSYFGNISYISDKSIYISQTGTSMDELDSYIDIVPLDGSSSAGITSSSELSAHKGIYKKTGRRAIVHGHPKFTVIMSMACRSRECNISTCYTTCKKQRYVENIPVVSGEIGTGLTGLSNTVPDAMKGVDAVIVYGHGIFAAHEDNFVRPFQVIKDVENRCRERYFSEIDYLLKYPF